MFNFVRNILQFKKRQLLTITDVFPTFVIQKYLSFVVKTPDGLILLNDKLNTNRSLHDNPQAFYDAALALLPKQTTSNYVPYLKKEIKDKKVDLDLLKKCSSYFNISVCELKEYLEIDPKILKKFDDMQSTHSKKLK